MMPCTIPAGWSVGSENPIAAGRLATELNIHPLLARLLAARGLNNPAQAAAFLDPHPTWSLEPRALAATVAAADAIRRAIKNDELILVHGDYDVDGLTATAILVRTLKALGGRCITYIPHRLNQGYGLGPGLPELVRRAGVGLLITADCGSGDSGVIDILVREGLRVVVTDHHQPGKPLPAGVIELNPKALTGEPAWINLCGAGVAFILARELLDHQPDLLTPLEVLAGLGTVADVVPLTGENRVLVKNCLEALNRRRQVCGPGLALLLDRPGNTAPITSERLAYQVSPMLNAAGRMDDPAIALELLLTEDLQRAAQLAGLMETFNNDRKRTEQQIMQEAQAVLQAESGRLENPILVLWGPNWHHGVIGIVASRLLETHERPVAIIGIKENRGRGSFRSISGYPVHTALAACSDLLISHGGHARAGGFSIEPGKMEQFEQRLQEIARRGAPLVPPGMTADFALGVDELNLSGVEALEALAPLGEGNPAPLFLLAGVRLDRLRRVGNQGKHLQARVNGAGGAISAVAFSMGERAEALEREPQNLLITPTIDTWQQVRRLRIEIRATAPAMVEGIDELHPPAGEVNDPDEHVVVLAPPEWVDVRENADSAGYLLNLASSSRGMLVLVRTPGEAGKLEQSLREKLSDPDGFAERINIRSFVGLEPGELDSIHLADVVLCHPPPGLAHFRMPWYRNCRPLRIHCLFTRADVVREEKLAEMLIPKPELLAQIHGRAEELGDPQTETLLNTVPKPVLQAAIRISRELAVAGAGLHYLEASPTYRRLCKRSEDFRKLGPLLCSPQLFGLAQLVNELDNDTNAIPDA